MLQKTRLLFLLLLGAGALSAQIGIGGSLTFGGPNPLPLPNWTVDLHAGDDFLATSTTNVNGDFSFTLDTTLTETTTWTLQVVDLCTGEITSNDFALDPGTSTYFLFMQLCTGLNPPPPTDTCQAFFGFEPVPGQAAAYAFTNLSVSTGPLDSLRWNFGDGNTSTEENPEYDFGGNGNYSVSLTIYAGDCVSTNFRLLTVFDAEGCDCLVGGEAVCVATFFGEVLTFENACLAQCAGYATSDFWDCDNDCGCPTFDAPICVVTAAGDTLSFTNHCFAECEGYGPGDWTSCGPSTDPCGCAGLPLDLVCVNVAGGTHFFANACEAGCAGFSEADIFDCDGEGNCLCPDFYDPVCVIDTAGGDTLTFDNVCLAECAGYGPADWFICAPELCSCPADNDPVCVVIDETTGFTAIFPNPCVAECAGYTIVDYDECASFTCDCPAEEDPVCVLTETGILVTFTNPCEAACFGYSEADFVDCDILEDPHTCQCQDTFNPVCVSTAEGDTLSFQNPCLAACEGYTEADFIDCEGCPCEAPDFPTCYYDPATGEILTFDNICEALCQGYSQDLLFYCPLEEDCHPDFTFTAVDDDPLTVRFTDQSFTTTPIDGWQWAFGTGATSTAENPTYTFPQAGVYEVTLVIESATCLVEVTRTVVVGEAIGTHVPDCQAFFFFEQPNGQNLLTYQFVDQSLGDIQAWIWDFGDNTGSFAQNPVHTYAEAGTYPVTLTVVAENGCESTIVMVLTVHELTWYGDLECRAWFLPIIIPDSNLVLFLNLSSADATNFFWEFGNGDVSAEPQPLYPYAEPGLYEVSLTITTPEGCENTFAVTLDLPANNFSSSPSFLLISGTEEAPGKEVGPAIAAPNPTRGLTDVRWQSREGGVYEYFLFDLNGRLLQQGEGGAAGGRQGLSLDLAARPAGLYLLRLRTPGGTQTLRISKL